MKICGNCGAILDDTELILGSCPECGSGEVDNAIKCAHCDDTIPEGCARSFGELKVCEDCYDILNNK